MGFKDTFKPCLWSEQNNKSSASTYDLEANAEPKQGGQAVFS